MHLNVACRRPRASKDSPQHTRGGANDDLGQGWELPFLSPTCIFPVTLLCLAAQPHDYITDALRTHLWHDRDVYRYDTLARLGCVECAAQYCCPGPPSTTGPISPSATPRKYCKQGQITTHSRRRTSGRSLEGGTRFSTGSPLVCAAGTV